MVSVVTLLVVSASPAAEFEDPVKWDAKRQQGAQIGRDSRSRVTAIVLQDGRVIRNSYHSDGRVNAQQLGDGEVVEYERNVAGTLTQVHEAGTKRELVYARSGRRIGTVAGGAQPDRLRAGRILGMNLAGAREDERVQYDALGRATRTSVAGATITYEYGAGPYDVKKTLVFDGASYSIESRAGSDGRVFVDDSLGHAFLLYGVSGKIVVADISGSPIAAAEFDGFDRVTHLRTEALNIEYVYGTGGQWTNKVLRMSDGRILRSWTRASDYKDPLLDGRARAELRSPTSDLLAQYDDEKGRTFSIDALIAPTIGADGKLRYFTVTFPSKTSVGADQIRLHADGTVHLLPALPRGEHTAVGRTVYPVDVTLPGRWIKPRFTMTTSSEHPSGSGTSREKRSERSDRRSFGRRPGAIGATALIGMDHYCEYIPGGSVSTGGTTTTVQARWECTTVYYYGDPWGNDPYLTGGGYEETTFIPVNPHMVPLTDAQSQNVSDGRAMAQDRLNQFNDCAALFDRFGVDGASVLNNSTYYNGQNRVDANGTNHCSGDYRAYTTVGSSTVYLCDAFATLSDPAATIILIHEALHSAGMTESPEDPGSPSSQEITDMVKCACFPEL